MNKNIRNIYNDSIFDEILSRYNIQKEKVKVLDGFENFMYEYQKDGKDYILRVSHSSHRDYNQAMGEIEWVNYLYENEICVPKIIKSNNGNIIEVIKPNHNDDELSKMPFLAVTFDKAEGSPVRRIDYNDTMINEWGKTMGKMHRLTKKYKPSSLIYKRHILMEDDDYTFNLIKNKNPLIFDKCIKHKERFKGLSTDIDSFGLIHTDFHGGNFFYEPDKNKITVFDFDDCAYGWFADDIGIVLYYSIWGYPYGEERKRFVIDFFKKFINGYSKENELDKKWLKYIKHFITMRDMVLFHALEKHGEDNLEENLKQLVEDIKNRITNDIPYVDVDFENI